MTEMDQQGLTYTVPWQNQTPQDKEFYKALGALFFEEKAAAQVPEYSLPDFLVWTIAPGEGQLKGKEPPPDAITMKIRVRYFSIQRGFGFMLFGHPFRIWHASKKRTESQARDIEKFHEFLNNRNEEDGVEIPSELLINELDDERKREKEQAERNNQALRDALKKQFEPNPRFSITEIALAAGIERSTMSEHVKELRRRGRIKTDQGKALTKGEAQIARNYAEEVKSEGKRKVNRR